MNAIERRMALARALSAHDSAAVKSMLDAAFVVRGTDGIATINCSQLMAELPPFFQTHPEYSQSVEIISSKIEGDTAKLMTRRTEVLRVLGWIRTLTSQWSEIWKERNGQWLLAEENPTAAPAAGGSDRG